MTRNIGVIFDMDGLMTDTERLFIDLWAEIMRERGLPEYREVVLHCIGLDHARTADYVAEQIGPEFDYMSVLMEVGARSKRYCAEVGVPVKPGLYELLDALDARGIPYAVATSTRGENARLRLGQIGVLDRLQGLVTGDMVTKGKPDPEIFLRAAEQLRLPPEDCVVLEDSPHGLLAAHLAGCMPVMIPDLKQPEEETLKILFALRESLHDIPALLDEKF